MPPARWGRYGWIPNSTHKAQITHLLGIPLATSSSRGHLEASRRQLMRDPLSKMVPAEAFVWPDSHIIPVSRLSLGSADEVEAAKQNLQSIDLASVRSGLHQENSDKELSGKSPEKHGNTADQAIKVSIVGLQPRDDLHSCVRLRAPVVDSDNILPNYIRRIQGQFGAAELPESAREPTHPLGLSIAILRTKKLCTTASKSLGPSVAKYVPEGITVYAELRVNVVDLYRKYQNFTWASDIRLERLSILEIGQQYFKRGPLVVGRGYREIATVPLPGMSHLPMDTQMENITYTPVKRIYGLDPKAIYDVTLR